MKKSPKVAALILASALLVNVSGCSMNQSDRNKKKTVDEYDFVAADVETQYDYGAIVMLSAEKDVFSEKISNDDVEVYAAIPTVDSKELVKLDNYFVTYQSPDKIFIQIETPDRVEMVSALIKKSGTLTKRDIRAASTDIKRTYGNSNELEVLTGKVDEIQKMLEKGVFDYFSSAVSVATGAYSALQAVELVEDPVLSGIVSIQKNLDIVSDQIVSMDGKLDSMYNSLDEKISTIDNTTRETLRKTYEQAWSQFEDKDYLNSQIRTYNNLYCDFFCNYTSSLKGQFSIYYDMEGNVTKPATTSHRAGTEWKSLDGTVIDENATITIDITEDTFAESSSIVNKTIDNEDFISTMKDELRTALLTNENVSEDNIEKVMKDAMTTISIDVLQQTMNYMTPTGRLADNIIDNYQSFCNALQKTTSNPIDAYRQLIGLYYNFQSEAEDDIEAFNNYILIQATDFRGYAELAARFGTVSAAKKNSIGTNSEKLAAYLKNNTGLVPEVEGKQYFYETGSYISATQFTANFSESVTCHLYTPFYFMYGGDYDSHNFSANWDREPKNLIPTDSLEIMLKKQKKLAANGECTEKFKDYFYEKLVDIRTDISDISCMNAEAVLSGSNTAIRDFTLDGTTVLKTYNDIFNGHSSDALIDDPLEFFTPNKEYKIGTQFDDSRAKKEYFTDHQSFYSDFLNLSTSEVKRNTQLSSAALFIDYRKSYYTDEMWEFAGFNKDLPNQKEWTSVYTSQSGDYTECSYYSDIIPLTYNLKTSATFWAITSD